MASFELNLFNIIPIVMTQEIALRPRAVQVIVDLVYQHNLPVQLVLASGATPTGLRFLTIEFNQADEMLAEWLVAKATADNNSTSNED